MASYNLGKVVGDDGVSLEYDWEGTSLGIKRDDEEEYTYVDLKGEKGEIGPQGPQGIQGQKGDKGDTGEKGQDGANGKDAKINGVNTLTLEAGDNIELDQEGSTLTISATGGGGGTTNYNDLSNKPKINNVELTGNKTTSDLGINIPDVSDFITKDANNLTYYTKSSDLSNVATSGSYNDLSNKPDLSTKQDKIDSSHKLDADLVDDTNSTNKFFSGNYNDLINKPDLSQYITKSVDDLINYYKKSETYTQAEINALIGAISTINLLVVQSLPTQDISTTTIYLVPKATSSTNNVYDEYIYVSNAWEKIGSTEVDLSNYYTKSQTDDLLDDKQDTLTAGTGIDITNNVISATGGGGEQQVFYYDGRSGNVNTDENKAMFKKIYDLLVEQKPVSLYIAIGNNDWIPGRIALASLSATNKTIAFQIMVRASGANIVMADSFNLANINNDIITCYNYSTSNINQYSFATIYTRTNTSGCLRGNNTYSYTPTADYNPSTKLYTDKTHYENMSGYDATKTQVLKNINGTLTWVDE